MPLIEFAGVAYEAQEGESVLECLLRHGVSVASSCRSGVCQSCVVKASSGEVPARARAGLKPAFQALGYCLACVCPAEAGLVLGPADAQEAYAATVERVVRLGDSAVQVFLRVPSDFAFHGGQFVQLVRDDGLTRPYSIANVPGTGLIELHVARTPRGNMSAWLAAAEGAKLTLRGPLGECFYIPGQPEQELLLVGTGTGLAPLVGVLRSALLAGHRGPIHLYHGSLKASGLYFSGTLRELRAAYPALNVVESALTLDTERDDVGTEPIDKLVLSAFPKLSTQRAYLCGHPGLVRTLRKKLYLAGASLANIHSDPFVEAPSARDA